jgi:hypothetical protein
MSISWLASLSAELSVGIYAGGMGKRHSAGLVLFVLNCIDGVSRGLKRLSCYHQLRLIIYHYRWITLDKDVLQAGPGPNSDSC